MTHKSQIISAHHLWIGTVQPPTHLLPEEWNVPMWETNRLTMSRKDISSQGNERLIKAEVGGRYEISCWFTLCLCIFKQQKHFFHSQWREEEDFLLINTNCLRFWHNYDSTYRRGGWVKRWLFIETNVKVLDTDATFARPIHLCGEENDNLWSSSGVNASLWSSIHHGKGTLCINPSFAHDCY